MSKYKQTDRVEFKPFVNGQLTFLTAWLRRTTAPGRLTTQMKSARAADQTGF
jgi:hypothetical protein